MTTLEAVVESVPHLPFFVAQPVAKLHLLSGLPIDQLLFVLTTLLNVPLGYAMRFVPGKLLRHIMTIFMGVSIIYMIIGWGFLHQLGTSLFVYLVVELFLPRGSRAPDFAPESPEASRRTRQMIGQLVFLFSMGYMCGSHIYRLYTDYLGYKMDFTAPQMVLTLKLVSYAWSRVDGETLNAGESLLAAKASKDGKDKDSKETAKDAKAVTEAASAPSGEAREEQWRAERAIRATPTLFEYFGWVFFFPGAFAGPAIDFVEYQSFVNGTLYAKFGLKDAPLLLWPALQKIGFALLCYPFMFLAGLYPIAGYVDTELFYTSLTRVQRVLYCLACNGFARFKYYFAWYLCEAGCVAYGLGLTKYDAKTGASEWDGMTNCRASLVETCTSVTDLTNHWNIRTSEWLKHNVYFRVKTPSFLSRVVSDRTFANVATKFVSAFWHGFYPGYYIFFLQLVFVQWYEGPVRAFLVSWLAQPGGDKRKPTFGVWQGRLFNLCMTAFVIGSFNFLGVSFIILQASWSWRLLADSYFFYHIGGFVLFTIVLPMLTRRSDKPAAGASAGAAPAVTANSSAVAAASAAAPAPASNRTTSPARTASKKKTA